jgi:hypothetical protein
MEYCTAGDVAAEINTTTFSTTTKPNLVQVETYCREIAEEMNARFRGAGIPEPLDLTQRNVEAYARMVAVNGVAARCCRVMFQLERAKDYQAVYDKMMVEALKNPDTVSPTLPSHAQGPDSTTPVVADADRAFTRETPQW